MPPRFGNPRSRARRQVLQLRQQSHTDKASRVARRLQAILLSLAGHTAPPAPIGLQVLCTQPRSVATGKFCAARRRIAQAIGKGICGKGIESFAFIPLP